MNEKVTEDLVREREARKQRMEQMQSEGRWEEASRYHETEIAPLNDELERRGVW